MNKSTLKKQEKGVSEVSLIIESPKIKEEFEKLVVGAVANFEAPGFRIGKAPRTLVEQNLDKVKTLSYAIQNILPGVYSEIIKEHGLSPVIDPKIFLDEPKNLEEILNGKDLAVRIIVVETPVVKLNDYKEKIKGESAKDKIWTPGKAEPSEDEKKETKEEKDQKKFMSVVDTLLKTAEVEMSEMIIENEANRLLSTTLEEIKKLGLSLDEYLKNTGKTAEMLKKEAEEKATGNLKLSFIFDEISRTEKITIEKDDLEAVFAGISDPKQKSEAKKNAYQIAGILLRQKVVDFLMKL